MASSRAVGAPYAQRSGLVQPFIEGQAKPASPLDIERVFVYCRCVVALQGSLLATGEPSVEESAPAERLQLTHGAWVDVVPGWLCGADLLFEQLVSAVPWRQGRRWMYERVIDDPRLSCWYDKDQDLPHPVLAETREAVGRRYRVGFGSVGLNYYRDGRDSVAFHRDRELRHLDDTLIAILTLGGGRAFHVRPVGGGPSRQLYPASGDLLVMGGTCQRTWEHAVPKTASAAPRISVSVRWSSGTGQLDRAPQWTPYGLATG
jgi:alkylated DNA repair dioxygenase AlkB